jgi:uncharacterized repeat protein (TIGR01451 family)
LAKSAPAAVEPGGTIQYTLRGGNAGPGLARQVIIKDTVPAGMVVLEDTITDAGYYHAGEHSVSWPLGELTAGSTVERGFAVLVPPTMRPGSRSLDNTAYISSPDAAPVYAYATTAISGTFTVAGLKRASAYTRPGEPIDYAIQVHNGSPTLVANVMIRDPLPEYTTYLTETASLPPAFADDGRTLIWTLGTLAAGETREVHFRTQVSGEVPDWLDRVTNLAQVAYSSGSFEVRAVTLLPAGVVTQEEPPTPVPPTPTPGPRSDPPSAEPTLTPLPTSPPVVELTPSSPTITPEATPLPVPGLHKTVSPAVVRAGQISDVSWKLNFSNPTPLTIGGLVIRDPLPAGLVYVSSQTSQGQVGATGSLSQTVVVANIGDLPPGGRVEVVILTQVLSTTRPAVYANTGRYSGLNLEPGVSNEAKLVVERGTVLLPITGGLLDPHTRIGKIAWGGGALLLLVLARSGLLKFLKL